MNLLRVAAVAFLIFYAVTAGRVSGAARSFACWVAGVVGAGAGLFVGLWIVGVLA